MERPHLLVVSREPAVLRPLWMLGDANFWQLENVDSGWGALERIQSGWIPNLLLLDLPANQADGMHLLRWLRRIHPELPIVVILDANDCSQKQEVIRLGARDCMVRPLQQVELEGVVKYYLAPADTGADLEFTSEDIEEIGEGFYFIAAGPVMRTLRSQLELLAMRDTPVLILGESGSGKETTARLIHKLSVRSGFAFAKINCATLPGDLLELELFGTNGNGNGRTKAGKLELCSKGTLLLEQITEMPLMLQAKLVKALQQNGVNGRPNGRNSAGFDVRILATNTTKIEPIVAQKRICEELYSRLSAYTIHQPTLRERKEEIPLLLQHFIHQLARRYTLPARSFSPAVLKACKSYSWPGNLTELEGFAKRYLLGGKDIVLPERQFQHSVPPDVRTGMGAAFDRMITLSSPETDASAGDGSLKSVVANVKLEVERTAISAALEKTGWNRKAAARLLKVSYRTLLYKIEQFHMKPSDSEALTNGARFKANGNGSSGVY